MVCLCVLDAEKIDKPTKKLKKIKQELRCSQRYSTNCVVFAMPENNSESMF